MEVVQQFNEINRDLDKCSHLVLKQRLPNKQLVLMTDASFTAAGYAILTEDDPIKNIFLSKNHMFLSHMVQSPFRHRNLKCPYTARSF